jgi:hypothetical protein
MRIPQSLCAVDNTLGWVLVSNSLFTEQSSDCRSGAFQRCLCRETQIGNNACVRRDIYCRQSRVDSGRFMKWLGMLLSGLCCLYRGTIGYVKTSESKLKLYHLQYIGQLPVDSNQDPLCHWRTYPMCWNLVVYSVDSGCFYCRRCWCAYEMHKNVYTQDSWSCHNVLTNIMFITW